jgi:ACT domain-containing protein
VATDGDRVCVPAVCIDAVAPVLERTLCVVVDVVLLAVDVYVACFEDDVSARCVVVLSVKEVMPVDEAADSGICLDIVLELPASCMVRTVCDAGFDM